MATVVLNRDLISDLRQFLMEADDHLPEFTHVTDGLYAFLSNHLDGVAISDTPSFNRMRDAELMLDCLKGAGVDNWVGYDDALEDYWSIKEAVDD